MWRVVVRCAFQGDDGAAMRAAIQTTLSHAKIRSSGEGTWECQAASPQQAAVALGDVLRRLADPSLISGIAPAFVLQNVSIEIIAGQSNPALLRTVDWGKQPRPG
jgi:hypothetical protein